ncbi:MAG: glycosyltransferase family 4 protein [Spongiibacteraceae bacterium]
MREFREVMERECCRAIMIQEYEYTRFDLLVRLAAQLRIPAYATFQGGDRTLSWVEKRVRKFSMKACAGLIIASSAERARVEQVYRHSHPEIARISNPLDCDEWRAIPRATARNLLGLSSEVFIAIEHCRIDIWRKGLDVLIDAWSSSRDGKLVIIGSGQDREAFTHMLSEHNVSNVQWIDGYTTDRQLIRNWLSAADVYVMASRVEGMPVAPLEAMACGLAVIATDAQGLPDILSEGENSGGILVPRENATALAAAIDRVRSSAELREKLGRAARVRVESAFSIPAVGNALRIFLG